MLTGMGYSLKDCEQEFKAMQTRIAEENVAMSSTGATLVESPLDMLKRRTKSDIIIQLGWQVNKAQGGHSVTFTLEAFDAYTSKLISVFHDRFESALCIRKNIIISFSMYTKCIVTIDNS